MNSCETSKELTAQNEPMFSAVIPIYNIEAYLQACIDSVLAQTYKNIEIVLVDDGSSDSCPNICDEYQKHHNNIKVLHKKNGGIVDARKSGVEIASGEYIACIDGDDWISPEYFQRFSDVIEKYNPDVVCCGYLEAFEGKNKPVALNNRAGYYSREQMEEEIFPKLLCSMDGQSFSPSLWAKVFRREIYQQQQLISGQVNMGEDSACVKPTVFHSESMYVIDECLYYYRQSNQSITRSGRAYAWDGPIIRAEHIARQMELSQFDFREQWYRAIVFSLFTVVSSQYNRSDSIKIINKEIRKNLQLPIYREALKNCHFKNSPKGTFRLITLKYGLLPLIRLYHKIKM